MGDIRTKKLAKKSPVFLLKKSQFSVSNIENIRTIIQIHYIINKLILKKST